VVALITLIGTGVYAGGGKEKSSSGPVTIRIWANDAHNKPELVAAVENFNKTTGVEKNMKIEYTVYGADYWTALEVALQADDEADIYKCNPKTKQYVEMGKALPLTKIPNFKDVLDYFAPYQSEGWTTIDGVPYNLPMYQGVFGMIWNKELCRGIGLTEPPRTWAEFEKACIAISAKNPGKAYGTAYPLKLNDFNDTYVLGSAIPSTGHFIFDNTTGRYSFSDLAPYFEMVLRIKAGGGLYPGMETLDDDVLRAQFAEGNVGFLIASGNWNVGVLYDQFPAKNEWDVAPIPVRDPNNYYNGVAHVSTLFAVSPKTEKNGVLAQVGEALRLFTAKDTRVTMYKNGKNISMDPEIAKLAGSVADRPQWNRYGEIAATSVLKPAPPELNFTIEGNDYYTVFTQIITGAVTPAAGLADLDKRYNEALDRAIRNGSIKIDSFKNPAIAQRFKAGR
jgi:multiple sugar transport system substrate-binding protein